MALINLALDQLERIESNISGIDNELLNKMLPQIETAINSISEDIQGSELQPLVKKINTQFETIKGGLSKGFTTLESFLTGQLKSYRLTEEQAQQELVQTLKKMLSLTGASGKLMAAGYNESGEKITLPINDTKQSNENSFWNDIKENWSGVKNNEGFFGKVGGIADGTTRTAFDVADGAWNFAGDVGNNAFDTVGNAANGVTDAIGDGVKNLGDGTFAEPVTNFIGTGIDKVGDGANWVADKAGDALNVVMEAPGNFMEWIGIK